MASKYTCRACARALRGQLRPLPSPKPTLYLARTLTTTTSLRADTPPLPAKAPSARLPTVTGIAQTIQKKAPLLTAPYAAYGAARELIKECSRPGEYTIPEAQERDAEIPVDDDGVHLGKGTGWWYETLGLTPTYSNWTQITFLHMYMLQVRMRMFPAVHAPVWIQHLTNHAFFAAEDRLVVWHRFTMASLRQKNLKNTFAQWRAVLLSYDEGLVKGDAMLAAAVWRNLLGGREDVDFEQLAQIVAYMRRELCRLDRAGDDEIAGGRWKFKGDPGEEAGLVRSASRLMIEEAKKA